MFQHISFLLFAYLFASIQEWTIHKYLMHSNNNQIKSLSLYKNHQQHHKTTNKTDYKTNPSGHKYICQDIISINGLSQIAILISINTAILHQMFSPNISTQFILATNTILLAINILVWNTFHSLVHQVDPKTICQPYTYLSETQQNYFKNTSYVKWLITNHETHHKTNNSNFNIVFPGADYLFETYNLTDLPPLAELQTN